MNIVLPLKRYVRRKKYIFSNKISSLYRRKFLDTWYKRELFKLNNSNSTEILNPRSKPSIGLETTDICNLNCVMCETTSASRKKGIMDMNHFIEHIHRLQELGQRVVSFHTIGDPLVDKDLPAKLKICYKRDIGVLLRTNGLLLHKFLDAIIEYPPLELLFSIDGATKKTYEKIRLGGKFDLLISNLKLAKNSFWKKWKSCIWGVNFTIFSENINEVSLFYEKFHEFFNLENMTFHLIESLSGDSGSFYKKEQEIKHLSQWTPPCSYPFTSLFILHDQKVAACCRDYHGDLIVGDLKHQTIQEIWEGSNIQKLRQYHMNALKRPEDLPKTCQNCYSSDHFSIKLDLYIHYILQKAIKKHGKQNLPHPALTSAIRNFIFNNNASTNTDYRDTQK